MSNDRNQSLFPSQKLELSKYSSDLIKRGLDLANKTQTLNDKSLQPQQSPTTQAEAEKLLQYGKEKYNKGDYQGAFNDFNQALRINPNYSEAYENRGTARFNVGDKQGAVDDYTQALQINPDYAEAYYLRGLTRQYLSNEYQGSRDYYTEDKQGAINDYTHTQPFNHTSQRRFYSSETLTKAIW